MTDLSIMIIGYLLTACIILLNVWCIKGLIDHSRDVDEKRKEKKRKP